MIIAGLTKISAKGQITIPKTIRLLLELEPSDNLLFMEVEQHKMYKTKMYIDKDIKRDKWEDNTWVGIKIIGLAKLTTQGQITLPKEVRDKFKTTPGERLLFVQENQRRIFISETGFERVSELREVLEDPSKVLKKPSKKELERTKKEYSLAPVLRCFSCNHEQEFPKHCSRLAMDYIDGMLYCHGCKERFTLPDCPECGQTLGIDAKRVKRIEYDY